jgi:hypothetical protein
MALALVNMYQLEWELIDTTSKMQDMWIDHNPATDVHSPLKQILNFDEYHINPSSTDPNQDLGPTARRYNINVTTPTMYIVNNENPNMPGTLIS